MLLSLFTNKSTNLKRTKNLKGKTQEKQYSFKVFSILIALLCFLTFSKSNAQGSLTPLFSYITDFASGISGSEKEKLDSMRTNALYDTVIMVHVHDISTVQIDGEIGVNYFDGVVDVCRLVNGSNSDMSNNPSELHWSGVFYSDSNSEGRMQLMLKDNEIFGTIERFESNENYVLVSFAPGLNAMARINSLESSNSICENGLEMEPNALPQGEPCTNKKVSILVCYTTGAKNSVPNIMNEINLSMAQLREAWSNSDDFANLDFELAGTQELPSSIIDENIYLDAIDFVSALSMNTTVQSLRNTFNADLVICLTGRNYPGNPLGTVVNGQVLSVGNVYDAYSYAMVKADRATVNFTFCHEIGHLMGGRHQQSNILGVGFDNFLPLDAHGYGFYNHRLFGKPRTTYSIMVTGLTDDKTLLFSTPDRERWGVPMGSNLYQHMVNVMKGNVCDVASFRTSSNPLPLVAFMDAPRLANPGNTIAVSGTAFYGTPPYTFDWFISKDAFTWIPLGMGSSKSFAMLSPQTVVQMIAKDFLGNQKTIQRTIITLTTATMSTPLPAATSPRPATQVNKIRRNEILSVFPNPTTSSITIRLAPEQGNIHAGKFIAIYDVTGKLLTQLVIDRGQTSYNFITSTFPTGTYSVSVSESNLTSKFTVK